MYKLPTTSGLYKVTLGGLFYNPEQIVWMELDNGVLWWPEDGMKVYNSYYEDIVKMEFVRENLSGR
jgi:hypothetical protein